MLLVGAGGHARAVVEALMAAGDTVVAYVDPRPASWLSAAHYLSEEQAIAQGLAPEFAIGIGGVTPAALEMRLGLFEHCVGAGLRARTVVHASATVSASASIAPGAMVLAGAVVQPSACVERAAIVNTGAILEHDSVAGEGSHLAPGAIVLGGCRIGRCALVGAGAVVLPAGEVAAGVTVPAGTRYPK